MRDEPRGLDAAGISADAAEAGILERWGIEAQHPDTFLTHQFHLSQPVFLKAVKTVRLRLKNPPKSVDAYLDTLRGQGLLATVSEIAPFASFI